MDSKNSIDVAESLDGRSIQKLKVLTLDSPS